MKHTGSHFILDCIFFQMHEISHHESDLGEEGGE